MRMSGAIRTAIISFATCSPRRTPASKRPSTISVRPLSIVTSTLISGYCAINVFSIGQSTASIACSPATMLTEPAGLSRALRSAVSSCSISRKCGLKRIKSCSPAWVGTTLRVVRVKRRTSNRASSLRMAWLSADCDTPSCAAARVKLRSRATTIKESRSLKLSFSIAVASIYEFQSYFLSDYAR